jgi:hypothetical protein
MDTRRRETEALFGSVPPDLFRVFSGPARRFYADLLTQLADDPFGHAGEIATRRRVFEAIAEFIERRGRAEVVEALSDDGTRIVPGQSYAAVYHRLRDTGWLVEYRDRYRKVVDFDPAARLVLHTLLDIQNGRVRSYGGAVLNVLTLLQSVEADNVGRALNVREAALAARGFMNHLRTVASTMRRIENLIMDQPSAAMLVRSFVNDFIETLVVQDYRNLHARESPYRFRGDILEAAERLLDGEAALAGVARGSVLGGVAKDEASAREAIVSDLREIMRVFGALDESVADIETTTFRIERRMTNVVRFSDRMATVSTDRILRSVELLRAAGLADDDPVDVRVRLQLETLPISPSQFYALPRRRGRTTEREVEVELPDPALLRYLEAVDDFERRVAIGPDRLRAYLDGAFGFSESIRTTDLPVDDVDDFLFVERIHEAGLGELADEFEVEPAGGTVGNDWVEAPALLVRRKVASGG